MGRQERPGRWSLAGILLAAGLGCVAAPDHGPPSRAEAEAHPAPSAGLGFDRTGPLLWQVRGQEGAGYVLATLSFGVSVSDLSPAVWRAFDESERVVVKTDSWNLDPVAMSQRMRNPGHSLRDDLTDRQWETLHQTLGSTFPKAELDELQPWFLVRNVVAYQVPTKRPLDVDIMVRAQMDRKKLIALEDWQKQVETIERVLGLADLTDTLDRLPEKRRRMEAMLAAYRDGDVPGLVALALDPAELARNPRIEAELIDDRNARWLPRIEELIMSRNTFFAVGVEQLLGQKGLLVRLEERGYRVTRVTE